MKKKNLPLLQSKLVAISLLLFVTFAIMATTQTTCAQGNTSVTTAWNLNLTLQANNGTTINSNQQATFAPFDLIQLSANIVSGNLTAPNTIVVFNVKGPSTSSFPTEITKSSVTDNASSANIIFRIPMETSERTVLGTWQILANVKASNGTLQQKATFQVAWPIQLTEINFINSKNQNQAVFAPGDTAKASLTLSSNQIQMENINFNVQDDTGKTINQTQMQNISFNATSTNQIDYEFKIPTTAPLGEATLNAGISSGSFQDTTIPSAQNKSVTFIIGTSMGPVTTPTPLPTPFEENTISLFSWVLVATGLFTFTTLFIFLKRKPIQKIGTTMPDIPPPTTSQTTTSQPQTGSATILSAKIAPTKTMSATISAQLPSIYETLDIPTPQSTSAQEQKQSIINYLTKISSINDRVQTLESELRIERKQLNKEIMGLTKTLEEQEKAVKDYFDSIRQEIAKISPNLNDKEFSSTQHNKPEPTKNNTTEKEQ